MSSRMERTHGAGFAHRRDLLPFTGLKRRWMVAVEWKPQDCWFGVFWRRDHPWTFDLWVCVLPMLPLHVGWRASVLHDEFVAIDEAMVDPRGGGESGVSE